MSTVLESVVGTLPAKAQPYAKTYAAALVAAVTVVVSMTEAPSWVSIALAVATAPVVFAVPNLDPAAKHQDESTMPPEAPALADPARVVLVDGSKPLPDEPIKPQGGVWGGG